MSMKISAALLFVLLAGAPALSYADQQQEVFASPEQAGKALVEANRTNNHSELLKILGPGAADLINSGDPIADSNARKKFVAAYNAGHAWEKADGEEVMVVGADKWPLPIPLLQEKGKWHFDTKAGRQEILERRIGHNELTVIKVCRAYVEAQADYASVNPGLHEYAQKFKSSPGKHDGLYWRVASGEKESPLGELVARAEAEGYNTSAAKGTHVPFHGYYFRILKAQSSAARGGAGNYVVNGHMTKGFALLAYPARYGDSGIKTFIVNQAGIVHEKDLGPNTVATAAKITSYDPDPAWQVP
jgi:hypothetical protein